MSLTVKEIFSRVQQDLGDFATKDIQLAEYIDACKDLANTLAYDTQVYLNEYIAVPNPSSSPIDPAPTSFTLPSQYRIARIDRVERNKVPCWEVGRSLVDNNNQNYYPYTTNTVDFGTNVFTVTRAPDDSHTFSFVGPIGQDEEITIRYFSYNDISPITWETNTVVPQVLVDVFMYGILERLIFRKMQQGMPVGIETRYPIALSRYQRAYGKAMAQTRNLIDNRAFIRIEPHKFLAE